MPARSTRLGFNAGMLFSSLRQPLIVIAGFAGVARFGACVIVGLGRSGDCGVVALCGACAYTVMDAAAAIAAVNNRVLMFLTPGRRFAKPLPPGKRPSIPTSRCSIVSNRLS